MDRDIRNFVTALATLRHHQRLTKAGASRACGMHAESFSRYERGTRIPCQSQLTKMLTLALDEAERREVWRLYRLVPLLSPSGHMRRNVNADAAPRTADDPDSEGAAISWLNALDNNVAPSKVEGRRGKRPVFVDSPHDPDDAERRHVWNHYRLVPALSPLGPRPRGELKAPVVTIRRW